MNIGNTTVEVLKELFADVNDQWVKDAEDFAYMEGYKEALRQVERILQETGAFECK